MINLTKAELIGLSNQELAKKLDFDPEQMEIAFANYNAIMNFISNQEMEEIEGVSFFLKNSENKEKRDLGATFGIQAVNQGPLENSLAELGQIKGIGAATILAVAEGLQELNLPDIGINADEDRSNVPTKKRSNGPREHFNPFESIRTIGEYTNEIEGLSPVIFANITDDAKELIGDLEKKFDEIKEQGKEFAEAAKKLKDAANGLKEQAEGIKNGISGTSTNPRNGRGEIRSGSQNSTEEQKSNITDDVYREDFITEDDEEYVTVWLDRLVSYDIDGLGENELYWAADIRVFLKDKKGKVKIIKDSFVSQVYDLDEFEALRLKPQLPDTGVRSYLNNDIKKMRKFITDKDASFALRADNTCRGIPLSRLIKIEIDFKLYETDSVDDFIETLAAFAAAATDVAGIFSGKFNASPEAIKLATEKFKIALEALNKLIAGDELIFGDRLTFTKKDFITAFKSGLNFPVRQRNSTAASGLDFQKIAGAISEDGNSTYDTGAIAKFLAGLLTKKENKDALAKNPEKFYEDLFTTYIEAQFRFEKLPTP